MLGMIGEVLAGFGMGEDRQSGAVKHRPSREVAEALGRDGQLTAAARMRPDRPQMKMADRDAEPLLRLARQRLRFSDLFRIVIDMRAGIADCGHAVPRRPPPTTCKPLVQPD